MNAPTMRGLASRRPAYVKNAKLIAWVAEMAALCKPETIYWCDGTPGGVRPPVPADGRRRHLPASSTPPSAPTPSSRSSDPTDVARVEDRTFICSDNKEDAGPTNNWIGAAPRCAHTLSGLFDGCMRGRTLYVVPFSHGPAGLADRPHRRRTVRQPVRGRQHEAS